MRDFALLINFEGSTITFRITLFDVIHKVSAIEGRKKSMCSLLAERRRVTIRIKGIVVQER